MKGLANVQKRKDQRAQKQPQREGEECNMLWNWYSKQELNPK